MDSRKDQMSCQGTANRHLCRIGVPDFSQHDDIGILPQECPQSRRKSQSDIFPQLHLIYPFQSIFHRVFYSEDIPGRLIQQAEGGI